MTKEFEKATGLSPKKELSSDKKETVFVLKDKSLVRFVKGQTRIEYYDKKMEFITAYTSVKQAINAFDQSGLI